ncbi:hypothetical protein [Ruania alba]|uniref:Uncharacterized protein n=1 Tax=Ruania alba TaxID=648782 RepID=A0A1H5G2S5_9MICO|nr:hypothetical protein [Ruania alba]SEE10016.1 hypothetical protein SAMN04488554_1524 [Ruania alba]
MSQPEKTRARRPGVGIPALIAGALGSIVLALGFTPTLAAFTASIQNTVDTAGAGTLTMQETDSTGDIVCNSTDGGGVSTNSATCSTINKYGGDLAMAPGETVSTDITISNTGTVPAASFSLTPGTCTQSTNGDANGDATDLCAQMALTVTSGGTTIYDGSLADFDTQLDLLTLLGDTEVAAGTDVPFTFAVTLDSTADNSYAGLQVSQPITWTFGA